MRIVVFSDSHQHVSPLREIVAAHDDADLFVHLGDGVRDFDDLRDSFPERSMMFIRGNCDWCVGEKTEDILDVGDTRIFFTHGHTYGVKNGLDELTERAKALGADIACFGHTHLAFSSWSDGLYLLNPGSVWAPRRKGPSYGIIDITDSGIAVNLAFI